MHFLTIILTTVCITVVYRKKDKDELHNYCESADRGRVDEDIMLIEEDNSGGVMTEKKDN